MSLRSRVFRAFRPPRARTPVGCFGKLPSHGDFLRRNADLPEPADLDAWVREGILATRAPLERFWGGTYDLAPPVRVYYDRPEARRSLCAFALASSDSVGRRYPFFVFRVASARGPGSSLARLVPAAEPFLRKARQAASVGHVSGDRALFLAGVERIASDRDADLQEGELDRWLETRLAGDLVAEALGDAFDPRRYLLFTALAAAARTGPEIWRVLRLPPCARAGDLGFWLHLLETLAAGSLNLRMILWNESLPGFPPRPVLFRERIEPPDFRLFLNPGFRDPRILDVFPAENPTPAAIAAARERAGGVLEDPWMTLQELAEALRGGRPARAASRRSSRRAWAPPAPAAVGEPGGVASAP